jgi:hypothetical protein
LLAYAFDIRHVDTNEIHGVGVFIPEKARLLFLAEGASDIETPALSEGRRAELTQWTMEGDANLPKRSAPLSRTFVSSLIGERDSLSSIGQRFAAFPLTIDMADARIARTVMAELLSTRSDRSHSAP